MMSSKLGNIVIVLIIVVVVTFAFVQPLRAKGVEFVNNAVDFVSGKNKYDIADPKNHVDDWLQNNAYSFIFIKTKLKSDSKPEKGYDLFETAEYQSFSKFDVSSGCDIGHEFPDYLNTEGCWIFSIEDDAALGSGDDCFNHLFISYQGKPLLPSHAVQNYYSPNCQSMGRSDSCHENAEQGVKDFFTGACNILSNAYCHVSPGPNRLCGTQKSATKKLGPKMWLLCGGDLAKKMSDQDLTLELVNGMGEAPSYYNCKCTAGDCKWVEFSNP